VHGGPEKTVWIQRCGHTAGESVSVQLNLWELVFVTTQGADARPQRCVISICASHFYCN